jgi:unsaturated rhamnogalacturonyl hydrolase
MMLETYFDAYTSSYASYKQGDWCYEDGCIYRGLILLDAADPQGPWFSHLKRLVDAQVSADGALAGYDPDEFNIDNIHSGRALIALLDRTGEARYKIAADRLAGQLARHPRIAEGNYWHKLRYPHQVWLDGLYMGLPFQIEYGQHFDRPDLIEDALSQLESALSLLADPGTGLYSHGYDAAGAQDWADAETRRSRALWSRAMGWLAMALVDIRALVGPIDWLDAAIGTLAEGLARHQRPDGRWNQVTDQPGLMGNYAEASATAMFAYFYLAGSRMGISGVDREPGRRALEGLEKHSLRKDGRRQLVLNDICHVAGLGGFGGRDRNGTAAYYVSEAIAPDDSKGVGPLMMAVAENEGVVAL